MRTITTARWHGNVDSVSSAAVADRLDISQRKKDHLALCAGPNVGFRGKTTLLEHVHLVHDALPELHADEVDLTTTLLGRKLARAGDRRGMTGGTERAAQVNRDLARAADELGLAFGLGSQRAMFVRPETAWTFQIRDAAPNVLLLGNLGVVQARAMTPQQIADLVGAVGADALCIHLNPAMEIVQPGGDRDFSGGLETLARLVAELPVPVVAKETGCGLSRRVAERIVATGCKRGRHQRRGRDQLGRCRGPSRDRRGRQGARPRSCGTGASRPARRCCSCPGLPLEIVATGGIKTGSDVARAVALGATVGGHRGRGAARAQGRRLRRRQGVPAARRSPATKAIMLLTGCRDVAALRRAPKLLGEPLRMWQPTP